jgi:2,6-dihydroxypyridine 3-monooxygenase
MGNRGSVAIIGGSIGGLTTALLLERAGFSASIYERNPSEFSGRGGGIVLQPEMLRWFTEVSDQNPGRLSTHSRFLRYLGPGNDIVFEEPVEWRFSSWSTLYRALLKDFGTNRYLLGHNVVGVRQTGGAVTVEFDNGATATADFAIFADGITSTGRSIIAPEAQPEYSGYIGWRGTVPEHEFTAMSLRLIGDALGYCFVRDGHICMYPIPGPKGEIETGHRLMNYVYYQNVEAGADLEDITTDIDGHRGPVSVPQGRVQERFITAMKEHANATLAPAAAELVTKTAEPYIQVIYDVRVPRMHQERIAILGDAAFIGRPHAAAGTAKAADDAWSLYEAFMSHTGEIPEVLAEWEKGRLAVGNNLVDRVSMMGRRAQFDHDWDPADPELRFGLKGGVLQPSY